MSNDEMNKKFGEALSSLRNSLKINQVQFCEDFNEWGKVNNRDSSISQSSLSNFERGVSLPGKTLLHDLDEYLKNRRG